MKFKKQNDDPVMNFISTHSEQSKKKLRNEIPLNMHRIVSFKIHVTKVSNAYTLSTENFVEVN